MQRKVIPASTQKPDNTKSRPRSSLLSWLFNRQENNHASSSSATVDEARHTNNSHVPANLSEHYMKTSHSAPTTAPAHEGSNKYLLPIVVTESDSQIQIPNRRQSHLYTPFHNQFQDIDTNNTVIPDKRRSYYVSQLAPIPDASNSTSSLSRSASWQPSSSSSALSSPQQLHIPVVDNIPARRTSRNYSEDPEIQAKLDAILSSEKAYFLSHVLHNNDALTRNNPNMYRRSTTPSSRPL
jgi:hypothetical protein